MPAVSLIVPVYNVENYLSSCVDSILAQTCTDFECILVDDGSQDGSARLCDAYASRDARIRVVHQANAGVSSARNAGIQVARGEWMPTIVSIPSICSCSSPRLKPITRKWHAVLIRKLRKTRPLKIKDIAEPPGSCPEPRP